MIRLSESPISGQFSYIETDHSFAFRPNIVTCFGLQQQKHSLFRNKLSVDKKYAVLIEGISKKSSSEFFGRTTENTVVVFKKGYANIGDFVDVKIKPTEQAKDF